MVSKDKIKSILDDKVIKCANMGYKFSYDIDTPCTEYICNKLSVDGKITPGFFEMIQENRGRIFFDFDYASNKVVNNDAPFAFAPSIKDADVKVLLIFFHELCHLDDSLTVYEYQTMERRFKVAKSEEQIKMLLINYINALVMSISLKSDTYRDYHNLFPGEHGANVTGLVNALKFKHIKHSSALVPTLTHGYERTLGNLWAPYDILKTKASGLAAINFVAFDKFLAKYDVSLYDRLKYGLPVSSKELEYAKSLKDDSVSSIVFSLKK